MDVYQPSLAAGRALPAVILLDPAPRSSEIIARSVEFLKSRLSSWA
jgi:hypothetical protein